MRGVDDLTAKEYLNQARTLDMLINSRQNELYKLRLMAKSVSSPKLGEKVKSGGGNNAMSVVDKIIDMQRQINDEIDKLVDLKAEIRRRIAMLDDPFEQTILTERYINNKDWAEIAKIIRYGERNIRYLHGRALQNFAVVCRSLP